MVEIERNYLNQTLRVAIAKWLPWIDYKIGATKEFTDLKGPMASLLKHFGNNLKVKFVFMEPLDGSWGKRLANGSYNGMIGMVHRNEVDFAVGPFTMTQERGAVVRFTHPIYHDFVTVLVGSQEDDINLFPFLRVFHRAVWLSTFAFFVSCVIVYIVVELLVKTRERRKHPVDLIGKAFVQFWGTLTSRSLALSRRATTSQNSLLTVSMIGSALLGWCLSGKLLSYLVVNKPEEFIDSLEAFQKFPHVIPVLESGTSAESMFENSRYEAARYLWRTVLKNKSASLIPTKLFQTKELMDLILTNDKYAAITEKTTVMALLSERVNRKWKCGYHATELKSFVKPMSIGIGKYLPSKIFRTMAICSNQMVESGMVVQAIKKDSETYTLCLQMVKEDELTVLNFADVAGIFTIYCCGTLISLVTCVLEIGFGKWPKCFKVRRMTIEKTKTKEKY